MVCAGFELRHRGLHIFLGADMKRGFSVFLTIKAIGRKSESDICITLGFITASRILPRF